MADELAPDPAVRTSTGRFAPGYSGNPGGRAKDPSRVRELAREHTEAAIGALVDGLKATRTVVVGKDDAIEIADHDVRIKAAAQLIDRGWGKAVAAVELSTPEGKRLDIAGARATAAELFRDPEARKAIRMAAREGT